MKLATAPLWNENDHPRAEGDGRFVDHVPSAPEVAALTPDLTATQMSVFRVPADALNTVIEQVSAANSRLETEGVDSRFDICREPFVERRGTASFEFVRVTLTRPKVTSGDWLIAGASDGGEIMPVCEQCSPPIAHTRMYVLSHPNHGTTHVGADCIDAFLGHTPAGLWAVDTNIGLDNIQRAVGHRASPRTRVYGAREVLLATLAASEDGQKYISVSAADGMVHPTVHVVRESWDRLIKSEVSTERHQLADNITSWARGLSAQPNSYLADIQAVFSGSQESPQIGPSRIGLAISAVSAYMSAQRSTAPQVTTSQKSPSVVPQTFLALPNEKIADVQATVQLITHKTRPIRGENRDSSWIVMVSDSGHTLTWAASAHKDFVAGDRVVINAATVKENSTFNGSRQTNITRAKISAAA